MAYLTSMPPKECSQVIDLIKNGRVGAMPTDTIYGIVASALLPDVVEQVYATKGRNYKKPFVVLIADYYQLDDLSVSINNEQRQALKSLWPGQTSVILACPDNKLRYLHRESNSLAARIPKPDWLRAIVAKTGPIVATSANVSGKAPLNDIEVIKKQLPGLDFYFGGSVGREPSRLISLGGDGTSSKPKR